MSKRRTKPPGVKCIACQGAGHRAYPVAGKIQCRHCAGTGVVSGEALAKLMRIQKDGIERHGQEPKYRETVEAAKIFLAEAEEFLGRP